ncbi:uncharacterized protein [Argopecten irradians]|uniref:uncharacterized protein n=1 Tax=Argopecten irradians TaxID=31199 RepID=UPI003717D543
MKRYSVFAVLVLLTAFDVVLSDDDDSIEKYEGKSLASEVVGLLNATYFNLNEKVCQLQRRVEAVEGHTNTGQQCGCNSTEIREFKRKISSQIHEFSKIMSEFENEMRILKREQENLREMVQRENTNDATTITTTTVTTTISPRDCDAGWIASPEKCYYVSTISEKTSWASAVERCSEMGADLVEFKSDKEASFVMDNLPSRVAYSDILYTGRKRNDDDVWVYISDNQVIETNERSWADDEPDGGTQRCGCTRQSEDFLMLDCFCTGYNLFYICEIPR